MKFEHMKEHLENLIKTISSARLAWWTYCLREKDAGEISENEYAEQIKITDKFISWLTVKCKCDIVVKRGPNKVSYEDAACYPDKYTQNNLWIKMPIDELEYMFRLPDNTVIYASENEAKEACIPGQKVVTLAYAINKIAEDCCYDS